METFLLFLVNLIIPKFVYLILNIFYKLNELAYKITAMYTCFKNKIQCIRIRVCVCVYLPD